METQTRQRTTDDDDGRRRRTTTTDDNNGRRRTTTMTDEDGRQRTTTTTDDDDGLRRRTTTTTDKLDPKIGESSSPVLFFVTVCAVCRLVCGWWVPIRATKNYKSDKARQINKGPGDVATIMKNIRGSQDLSHYISKTPTKHAGDHRIFQYLNKRIKLAILFFKY